MGRAAVNNHVRHNIFLGLFSTLEGQKRSKALLSYLNMKRPCSSDTNYTVPTMRELGLAEVIVQTPFRGGESAALERMEMHLRDKVRGGFYRQTRQTSETIIGGFVSFCPDFACV